LEGGDEHLGVAVADEEDVRSAAADDGAVVDWFAEAVHECSFTTACVLPVEVFGDGGEAVGGGCLRGGGCGVGGVDDGGDEQECGDDADGEAGGDDGAAVLVEESAGADWVFEELVAEGGEGGGEEGGDADGGEGGGVEGSERDEDDEPVPELGAVGDFSEVDGGGG
jgi:hypothetical protein